MSSPYFSFLLAHYSEQHNECRNASGSICWINKNNSVNVQWPVAGKTSSFGLLEKHITHFTLCSCSRAFFFLSFPVASCYDLPFCSKLTLLALRRPSGLPSLYQVWSTRPRRECTALTFYFEQFLPVQCNSCMYTRAHPYCRQTMTFPEAGVAWFFLFLSWETRSVGIH